MSLSAPQRRALTVICRGRDGRAVTQARIADRCQMHMGVTGSVLNALMRRGLVTAIRTRYRQIEGYIATEKGRRLIA